MTHHLLPLPRTTTPDVRVLAQLMADTEPDLWEPAPGETREQQLAREAARSDIIDDLLADITPNEQQPPATTAETWGWAA